MTSVKVKATRDDQGQQGFKVRVTTPIPLSSVSNLAFFFHDFTIPACVGSISTANDQGESQVCEVWVRALSEEEREESVLDWPYRVEIRNPETGKVTPRADHYSLGLAFVAGQLIILSDAIVEYTESAIREVSEAFQDNGKDRLDAMTAIGQQVIGVLSLARIQVREILLEELDTFPEGKAQADEHRRHVADSRTRDVSDAILRGMQAVVENAVGTLDKGKMPA